MGFENDNKYGGGKYFVMGRKRNRVNSMETLLYNFRLGPHLRSLAKYLVLSTSVKHFKQLSRMHHNVKLSNYAEQMLAMTLSHFKA